MFQNFLTQNMLQKKNKEKIYFCIPAVPTLEKVPNFETELDFKMGFINLNLKRPKTLEEENYDHPLKSAK